MGNNRSNEFSGIWAEAGAEIILITSTAFFPADHIAKNSTFIYEFRENKNRIITLNISYNQQMSYFKRVMAFILFFICAFGIILRLVLQGYHPDLIYASSTPPTVGELGLWSSVILRSPFVFEVVDVWPQVPIGMGIIKNKLTIRILNFALAKIYRSAKLIIPLSDGMKDQILDGAPNQLIRKMWNSKMKVVYNGAEISKVNFIVKDKIQPQEGEINFHPTFRMIYTGAVGRVNGVDSLLDALLILKKKGKEYRLDIFGWGSELEKIQQRVNEYGLKNVHFKAPLPKEELLQIMTYYDIGILTVANFKVLEANSANKFYDYLAAGLPVVINYEGWQADFLHKHNCGKSSPQGDVEEFANNILELMEIPLPKLRLNARRAAEIHFDRKKLATELYEDLKKIANLQKQK